MRFFIFVVLSTVLSSSCYLQSPQGTPQNQPSVAPPYPPQPGVTVPTPPVSSVPIPAPVSRDDDRDDDRGSRFDRDDDRDDRRRLSSSEDPFSKGSRDSRYYNSQRGRFFNSSRKKCEEEDWGDNFCYESDGCLEACNRLFNDRSAKGKCSKYPVDLIYEINLVVDNLNLGDVGDLASSTDVLRCVFRIDEHPIRRAVSRLSSRGQKDMLSIIAENEEVAALFANQDDEFDMFNDLVGNDLDNLKSNILSGASFLEIVADNNNEEAWSYLESYIDEEYCRGDGCPYSKMGIVRYDGGTREDNSGDHISTNFPAYCEILSDISSESDVRNVLLFDSFQDEYGDNIRKNLERTGSDANEYRSCASKTAVVGIGLDDSSDDNVCEEDQEEDFGLVCEEIYGVNMAVDTSR